MNTPPIALGAWTPPGPKPWAGSTAAHYVATFGHAPAIIHYYQDLAHSPAFDAAKCNEIHATGAIPLISWELDDYTGGVNQPAYSNAAVLAGNHDAQLVAWLTSAAAWGKPFLLRFFWEMTGRWYPWAAGCNGNTPGSCIDAWRHVANLVYTHCPLARNVWCPSVEIPGGGLIPLEDCWPGERWVDVASLDGYNKGPHNPGGVWRSFNEVFRPSYDRLLTLMTRPRPILLAEVGCHAVGGDRAAWLADMGRVVAGMSAVSGLCWWNNASVAQDLDCRLDGDPATLAAWRALAADPQSRGSWR